MWNDTFQKFKKLGTPLWKMRQLIAWPLGPRLALGPRISSVVRFSRLWHLPCWAKVAWHLPTAIVISTVEYWRCEDPYRPGKNTSRCWGFQVGKQRNPRGLRMFKVGPRYRTSSWGLWQPKRTTLQLTPCLMLALRFHHGLRGWQMLTILLTGERGFCYHVANQIHVARHFHDWQPPRIPEYNTFLAIWKDFPKRQSFKDFSF